MLKANSLRGLILSLATAAAAFAQSAAPSIQPASQTLNAFVGESFSQVFTCALCPSNTVYSYSGQGPLPSGLSFNGATRTLSGVASTPNQAQSFAIIATSGSTTVASRSYGIVTDRRLAFLTSSPLPPATAGIPVSRQIQVSLPSAWDNGSSNLPSGVNLIFSSNSTSVTLAGTFPPVSVPTTYQFQVYASYPSNSSSESQNYISQNVNRVYSIVVNPPPSLSGTLPAGQVGIPYNASVTTTGGTAPFTYSPASNLPPGLTINPSTGVISGIPTLNGNFPFQITVRDANGATAFGTYTTPVTGAPLVITSLTFPAAQVAQNYSQPLTVTGGTAPFTWSILTPTQPPGIGVAGSSLVGIPNTIGIFPFTLRVQDSAGLSAQANVTVTVNPALLTISTATLPNGTPNAAYSSTLTATGGYPGYTWALDSGTLPTGLSLTSGGVITGTPTTSGTSTFSIRVTDSPNSQVNYLAKSISKSFTLTIGAGTLSITTTTLPAPVVGQAFTSALAATGGTPPYTWSISGGTLPPGVTLGTTGTFTGAPTAPGASTFTVQVTDSANAVATRSFTVSTAAALAISTESLGDGVVGSPYSATLATINGTAPYAYTLASDTLPAGITLSTTGIISGTPTAAGTFNFTARVTDRGNLTATKAFSLIVRPPLSILTTELTGGNVGSSYSGTVAAEGGLPPYSFSVSAGSLPPGVNLGTDGTLTGTPTTEGSSAFTVRVTDSRSIAATRAFTLAVTQAPVPAVTVTQITDTTTPATQPAFGVQLSTAYPTAIDGTVTLGFQPENGPADPDVKLANGATTMNFTIPQGQTSAVPPSGSPFMFSSGTTAGTITLTVVLRSNGQVLNPNPAATRTIRINPSAPVITSVRINRTATGFDVLVIGYSNTRQITSGVLRFNPFSGVTLAAQEFPLNLSTVFQTWYNSGPSANFGTQFLLTIPFTVADGTAASLSSVQVTLTNSAGSGSALGNF